MDDAILLAAKKSPKKSSKAIEAGLPQEGKVPSQMTIRRRLFDAGLKSYKPAKKPRLSSKNIADRLAFCQKYKDWSNEQWKRVMFSDETLISQFYAFCRHVRRPPNKRDDYRYIVPSVKNAPKVMIWGGICAVEDADCGSCLKDKLSKEQRILKSYKPKFPNSWRSKSARISSMMGHPATIHGL